MWLKLSYGCHSNSSPDPIWHLQYQGWTMVCGDQITGTFPVVSPKCNKIFCFWGFVAVLQRNTVWMSAYCKHPTASSLLFYVCAFWQRCRLFISRGHYLCVEGQQSSAVIFWRKKKKSNCLSCYKVIKTFWSLDQKDDYSSVSATELMFLFTLRNNMDSQTCFKHISM